MATNSQFENAPRNRGLVRVMLGAGAVALVAGGFLAGSLGDGKVKVAEASSPVVVEQSTTTVAPAPAPAGTPDNSQARQVGTTRGTGSGQSTGSGQQSGGQAGSQPGAPAPVILSFHTPENIDCHNGNFQTFSASWTTKNAVKTTISIDGPGIYKTYPANADESLPFNCSSPHTFLLTAFGSDGTTVSRSITLQPRNVQTPSSGDDDL